MLVVLLAVPACRFGSRVDPASAASAAARDLGLEKFVRIFGIEAGREPGFQSLLDELGTADVVFVGETHLDEITHRFELALLDGLADRTGNRVVLAMEMFATDVQAHLDDYLAGRIDEAALLERARPWKNYATGYRPLIERARERGLPVVGSNIPTALRRTIARGGKEAFESLTPRKRALVPLVLYPNSQEYWERYFRAIAGHQGDIGERPDPQDLLYTSQSLWDNTMGWSCARALDRFPGYTILHLNGGFHTKYHQGAVQQLLKRRPRVKVATITVIPVSDLQTLRPEMVAEAADYLVFAESRARGLSEGYHAVTAAREVRYRLSIPASATDGSPVPLLIWLPPDGIRAREAEAYWRIALADEAAIAVVEAPYTQLEEDLHLGGRWYWSQTFDDDLPVLIQALERTRGYLLRHYPVDRSRVVVAGAGAGATVVIAAARESDHLPVEAVAIEPRRFLKLFERPLPDEPPQTKGLAVIVEAADAQRWESQCRMYRAIGLDATHTTAEAEDVLGEGERRIRASLGLSSARPSAGTRRIALYLTVDSPLARHWARVYGRRLESDGSEVTYEMRWDASAPVQEQVEAQLLAFPGEMEAADLIVRADGRMKHFHVSQIHDGHAIPPAPGPFGGTTVVVVPSGATRDERQGWEALARSNLFKQAHGRFYRLRVALDGGEPRLADVLSTLLDEGRTNVLIVPAAFCADARYMRSLRDETTDYADRMTITWLPGLGGGVHVLAQ